MTPSTKVARTTEAQYQHHDTFIIDSMAQDIPKTVKQWTVTGTTGFDALSLSELPVPELGDGQVLVKRMSTAQHAVSFH